MDVCMDGWMDGWMDTRHDRWMDGVDPLLDLLSLKQVSLIVKLLSN